MKKLLLKDSVKRTMLAYGQAVADIVALIIGIACAKAIWTTRDLGNGAGWALLISLGAAVGGANWAYRKPDTGRGTPDAGTN